MSTSVRGDAGKAAIYEKTCDWLETADGKLHTLEEFHRQMFEEAGSNDDIYSITHLKCKLVETYGSQIQFSSAPSKLLLF